MRAQGLSLGRGDESSMTRAPVAGRSSQGYLDWSVMSRALLRRGRDRQDGAMTKDVPTLLLRG